MARFIARRLLLSLVTLWLLATIVFVIANVLPNDVGRTILGPFAPQESVDALNERLGTNRPIVVRYVDSLRRIVTLDFGDSFVTGQPVLPQLAGAIGRSAKLAGLALLITIPLSILGRALRRAAPGSTVDRAIVLLGVTSSSIPEFVTGTILVVVVGVQLRLAAGPRDAAADRRRPDHDPLPADAGHRDGDRLLRLHRADDPRRHDRGPPVRLHPDGHDEGAHDGPDDAPARPAQRAGPDRGGHRGPDRLPVRRDHRGREDLQLQRDGPDDAVGRPAQGHPDADRRRDRHRHRVHARDPRRRHDDGLDEPRIRLDADR